MPVKKTVCIEDNCDVLTRGKRCVKHRYSSTKVWTNKGDAQRNHAYKRKYNLTLEEVYFLFSVFHGKCGICKNNVILPTKTRGQPLNAMVIDHNHKTGNVRGILCGACNKGIGFLKDDPKLLKKAMEWCDD